MLGLSALAPPLLGLAAATPSAFPIQWFLAPLGSLVALFFAWYFYKSMLKADPGNERMQEIAGHVREGAQAYLRRQYKVVAMGFVVLAVIFFIMSQNGLMNPFVPFAFLTGGFFSGLCGYLGMKTATMASSRTAQGAIHSLNQGLQVAFRSGAVMGLIVVGFGLLDICLWYLVLNVWYDHNWMNFAAELAQKHGLIHGLGEFNDQVLQSPEFFKAKLVEITTTMITFGMGASTQALFARVGGGIFTKAADVGADLVGKVEAGIPEDDPRNPATIADNVGDNVGDVAGMGADLYESYCGSILATAALGAALPMTMRSITPAQALGYVVAPMIVAGLGILLSVLGIFMVRTKEEANLKTLLRALLLGTGGASALILVVMAILAAAGVVSWGIFGSVAAGLLAGVIIGQSTEYYTADEYKPTQGIASQAPMGAATVIIEGLAVGMLSSGIPVITIVVGILCAYGFAGGFGSDPGSMSLGLYGVGFAAVGMLATLGITLATDAYGPIADNAGGNAEMSGLDPSVRLKTDNLDMLGNTTAATGKGFAIGSAALTAMALLAAYLEEVRTWLGKFANDAADKIVSVGGVHFTNSPAVAKTQHAVFLPEAQITDFLKAFHLNIMNPLVICGLFLGAMAAFVFCALTMKAVGRAAGKMVNEVRRQFREIPGIMEGKAKPDYAKCVEISTAGAQREMMVPSFLAIILPLATGIVLGVQGVMGLLAGALAAGFSLACLLNNAGGAWDNAKKFIEKGNFGGKFITDEQGNKIKNPAHGAAVIGDTVGDPCKDTAGPSLNILIKLMSMVSVVFAGLVVWMTVFHRIVG